MSPLPLPEDLTRLLARYRAAAAAAVAAEAALDAALDAVGATDRRLAELAAEEAMTTYGKALAAAQIARREAALAALALATALLNQQDVERLSQTETPLPEEVPPAAG
jgi:hypothetical protein